MVVRRREEEKRTRREETTQTPPQAPLSHGLRLMFDEQYTSQASRQSISAPPSTLPHRISRITPGDPSDWDSQDLSREEDDTLQHWLYMYSDRRTGEPENRRTREPEDQSRADRAERTEWSRQSGADTNDRERQRNSTPKPDPSRNTRNAPNEAPP